MAELCGKSVVASGSSSLCLPSLGFVLHSVPRIASRLFSACLLALTSATISACDNASDTDGTRCDTTAAVADDDDATADDDDDNDAASDDDDAASDDDDATDAETGSDTGGDEEVGSFRPRSNPIEFIGVTVERNMTLDEFLEFMSPFFGEAAASGQYVKDARLKDSIWLSTAADERTPDQVIITGDLIPVEPTSESDKRRTMVRVPASRAYGQLFLDAVEVAAKTALDKQATEGGIAGEPFWLEYRARSSNGGSMNIRFDFVPDREPRTKMIVSFNTPQTSLLDGKVNAPAFTGQPYESIAGTAWFRPSRDEFSFFVQRAYGISPGADQNFKDFQLLPHRWLRLTVTPMLKEKIVDVAFEVVKVDGTRVPIARAPASFIAGDQFRQAVLTMLEQNEQEAKNNLPFTDWQSPFYYDDPQSGGVVAVVAGAKGGRFDIAYAVESPTNFLRDVDFVAYPQTIEVPDEWPTKNTDCTKLGSYEAPQGRFKVRFETSDVIRKQEKEGRLKAPLVGHVYGSIYRSEDVTIGGPKEGTSAVASFDFDGVDVRNGESSDEFMIDEQVPAGAYQILGFMDIDDNADEGDPSPDVGDPVFIPIGGFELKCYEQPFDVQFAITLPEGNF